MDNIDTIIEFTKLHRNKYDTINKIEDNIKGKIYKLYLNTDEIFMLIKQGLDTLSTAVDMEHYRMSEQGSMFDEPYQYKSDIDDILNVLIILKKGYSDNIEYGELAFNLKYKELETIYSFIDELPLHISYENIKSRAEFILMYIYELIYGILETSDTVLNDANHHLEKESYYYVDVDNISKNIDFSDFLEPYLKERNTVSFVQNEINQSNTFYGLEMTITPTVKKYLNIITDTDCLNYFEIPGDATIKTANATDNSIILINDFEYINVFYKLCEKDERLKKFNMLDKMKVISAEVRLEESNFRQSEQMYFKELLEYMRQYVLSNNLNNEYEENIVNKLNILECS